MTRSQLRTQFDEMAALPESAQAADKRRRGQQFEVFLKALLEADGLSPRIRIRPDGEEIDGSFVVNDRVFLLEAKWHAAPLPASSIYQFKGKVDGKLIGTLGVFISISGYGEDTVNALTLGKDLNVILFDRSDIEVAIANSFRTVLQNKLRAAAEEGIVYFPSNTTVASSRSTEVQDVNEVEPADRNIHVIVEGSTDEKVLAELARRIIELEGLPANLRFFSAGGKQAVGRLSSFAQTLAPNSSLIVVADTDGDRQGTSISIMSALQGTNAQVVLIEPELEAWLVPESAKPKEHLYALAKSAGKQPIAYAIEQAKDLSIDALKQSNKDFAAFYEAVVLAASYAQPIVPRDAPQAARP